MQTWASVAEELAGEDQGKNVLNDIEYLSLLHVPGNQVSHFFPERAHIFTNVPIEAFFVALDVLGLIEFNQAFSFLT